MLILFFYIIIIISISIIIIEKGWQCKAGTGDYHPISPKTPAPQYQPIEWKKWKGNSRRRRERAGRQIKMHWPCSWNPPVPHHRIHHFIVYLLHRFYWEKKSWWQIFFYLNILFSNIDSMPKERYPVPSWLSKIVLKTSCPGILKLII